jgi:predicted DNA-binding antitoxin AbrB/MazE fold protein
MGRISSSEPVCGILGETAPWARKPGARALHRPVRALLGGEDLTGRLCLSLSLSGGGRGFAPAAPAVYYRQRSLIPCPGAEAMTLTIEAVYENGVLKPKQPLALVEGTEVRLTLSTVDQDYDPLAGVIGIGDSGRADGADNHDHYIYGTRKRR